MSEKGCALVRQNDIEYWGVDDLTMEPCCALKHFPQVDLCQSEKDGDIAGNIKGQVFTQEYSTQACPYWIKCLARLMRKILKCMKE